MLKKIISKSVSFIFGGLFKLLPGTKLKIVYVEVIFKATQRILDFGIQLYVKKLDGIKVTELFLEKMKMEKDRIKLINLIKRGA